MNDPLFQRGDKIYFHGPSDWNDSFIKGGIYTILLIFETARKYAVMIDNDTFEYIPFSATHEYFGLVTIPVVYDDAEEDVKFFRDLEYDQAW